MAGLSVPLDEVIHFDVVTHDPATGGRVTATSITFDVFEEATDTAIRTNLTLTERAGATGVFRGTDTISAANGYEVGKYYSVIAEATAGGVVGQSVALSFRVVAAESVAGVPEVDITHQGGGAIPAPAVTGVPDVNLTHHVDVAASLTNNELDVNVNQIIGTAPTLTSNNIDVNIASTDDIDLSATQKASVNTEIDNALVDINLDHLVFSAVPISFEDTVDFDSVVGQLAQNSFGTGTGSGGFNRETDSLEAIKILIDDVEAQTSTILTTVGAILVDTTSLDDTKIPDILSLANINAEIDTALSDINLDHLVFLAVPVSFEDTVDIDSVLGQLASDGTGTGTGGGGFNRVTDSLEAIADGELTVAGVADAVWDEDIVAAHGTSDTAGLLVRALGAVISQRSNNATLDALLGVADVASTNISDMVWDEILTGGTHNVADSAGRRIRDLQEFGIYEKGAIWIDTISGTAGTTDFESGTVLHPVDSIADANTLSASLNINRFEIDPGSSITLPGSQTNQIFEGRDWTLILASRDITGSFIFGATSVTGVSTATAGYEFEECDLGAVTMDNDGHFERCSLGDTFTIGQAGTFTFHNCFSLSGSEITIDFGGMAGAAVHLFQFDGEINFSNMAPGDTVHITGAGTITTTTCTGGIIEHDGFFEYTDAGGNVTEVQSDIKVAVDSILVDTAEIGVQGAGLLDLGGMSTAMKAEINAEVLDVMNVDVITLPGQLTPPASPTRTQMQAHLYKAWLHKADQDDSEQQLYSAAGTVVDQQRSVSEVGGVVTIGAVVTGP